MRVLITGGAGFGGSGKQVRDMLHVEDAVEPIDLQLAEDLYDWVVRNESDLRRMDEWA